MLKRFRVVAWLCATSCLGAQVPLSLPPGNGKKLVERVCTKCHKIQTFAGLRLSRDEWKFEVDGMIARGAKANRSQARQIVNYLAAHFGKQQ